MRLSGKRSDPGDGRADTEVARLLALDAFEILDTPPESSFDGLTSLAAYVCDAPMAAVTFIDSRRQWLKSRHGIDLTETPRELSFCAYAIGAGVAVLEIPDTHLDPRFATHPMVVGEPYLRFYAGAPILTDEGYCLGTICVMDHRPKTLSDAQRAHLQTLARQVLSLLQLRSRARQYTSEIKRRLAADEALRQQQHVLRGVLEHTDVLVFAKDVDGRFLMANHALQHVTRVDRPLIGGTDYDFFPRDVADGYRRNDRRIMDRGELHVFNEEMVHPDGSVHTYRSTKFPLLDDVGDVIGVGGVSTDVTELVTARAAHAAAEQRWRALVEHSPAAVIVVDADGELAYVNPEGVALLGADSAEQVASMSALRFVPARIQRLTKALLDETLAGRQSVRARRGVLRRLDGTEVAVEFHATAVNHSGEQSVQLEVRDVSEAAAAHAELKHVASTDPLTGLLNRRAWDLRVGQMLAGPADTAPMAIAVIDLDNFKSYNDTRGHTAGDALLQQFATAAAAVIRSTDVLARWGGEEFIVALPGTTPGEAETILQRLRRCVPSGQTCSIGYTEHRDQDTLLDSVVRADRALYEAKTKGRNQVARL